MSDDKMQPGLKAGAGRRANEAIAPVDECTVVEAARGEAAVGDIDSRRRDMIRRVLLGTPVIVGMSAKSAWAQTGSAYARVSTDEDEKKKKKKK